GGRRGGAVDEAGAEITALGAVEGQKLADREGDRAVFGGDAKQLSLEIRIGAVLRPGDEAVDRVVELRSDRDGVGTFQRRLDEERTGDVADVGAAVVQRLDQSLSA